MALFFPFRLGKNLVGFFIHILLVLPESLDREERTDHETKDRRVVMAEDGPTDLSFDGLFDKGFLFRF
jgi:hypothetical protein